MFNELKLGVKWAIMYDPTNNKPMYWTRHGRRHSAFNNEDIEVTAMFYELLKEVTNRERIIK